MFSKSLNKLKIAIIGASGYTGRELIRILLSHPLVQITAISSRTHHNKKLSEVFNNLGILNNQDKNLKFCNPEEVDYKKVDLVFFATPHGWAQKEVSKALKYAKVIDLSADFRIKDVALWEKWYKTEHQSKDLLKNAVYGLSEIYPSEIKKADLIANPGCYPTSILLPLIPLIKEKIIDENIIADCKSGTSGAGAKADLGLNLSEIGNNFKMYNAFNHRHIPEITEQLKINGLSIDLAFTTNLLPIPRGMMSSIYVKKTKNADIFSVLKEFYKNSIFVGVKYNPSSSDIKSVLGTNCCDISIFEQEKHTLITSSIDNLIKGASGQAVQNMNLMFGFEQTTGLTQYGIYP